MVSLMVSTGNCLKFIANQQGVKMEAASPASTVWLIPCVFKHKENWANKHYRLHSWKCSVGLSPPAPLLNTSGSLSRDDYPADILSEAVPMVMHASEASPPPLKHCTTECHCCCIASLRVGALGRQHCNPRSCKHAVLWFYRANVLW